MVFNIPEWPKDNDLKHKSTTWELASDIDFKNIQDKVEKSEDALIAWMSDIIIPTKDIWYVRAKRHLEDSDGNEIDNDKWIGPKPVFSEETNTNDYLAPKFEIVTPYITDIVYTSGKKLELTITPFEGNIGYKSTMVMVKDNVTDKILSTKNVNLKETDNKVTFDNNDIDFTDINGLVVHVIHRGTNSTLSRPYVELIYIKKVLYNVEGNRTELDPNTPSILKITSTSDINVKVESVVLNTITDERITDIDHDGNEILLPMLLDFDKSYHLALHLSYIDSNGDTKYIDDIILISTREFEEKITIDPDRKYNHTLEMIDEWEKEDGHWDYLADGKFNTEELFTNMIPIINDNDDKNVAFYSMDKKENIITKFKDGVLGKKKVFLFRLLTKEIGFSHFIDNNDKVYNRLYKYDSYEDKFHILNTLDLNVVFPEGRINPIVELNGKYFIVGTNKDDAKKYQIYELDINTGDIKLTIEKTLDKEIKSISAAPLDNDNIIMAINNNDEFRLHTYSLNDKYITDSLALPDDFRNKPLFMQQLHNGNIGLFKIEDINDPFDFAIINIYDNSISTYDVDYKGDKNIKNMIMLKNGNILFHVKDDDKKQMWLFS